MTRKVKNIPFTANCAECGTVFETAISTKLYCSWQCAKRAENTRRLLRTQEARANVKAAK